MNKKWVVLIIACSMMATAWSQTLFTYGNYKVDAKEFLRAYNKNNSSPVTNKSKAINDYLNLYIRSRLKIREAYNKGYDTLSQLREELASLRSQIAETYMNDPVALNHLIDEAFKRSQKDIHVAHIYIGFKNANGQTDSASAQKRINGIYQLLQKGKDFFEVAAQYSDDPSAKTNKGDLGFITVFTLPYEFENIVYNTPVNKFSTIYRSKGGYHIFKNIAQRKPLGKMKAEQILLAVPPGSNDSIKTYTAQLADSLYQRLLKGDDFAKLVTAFSNDYISASAGGVMPEFSVGQYDPVFEKNVFDLTKNGAITKPFQTSHGFHIVKRISITPVITDPNNKNNLTELRNKVELSDRI
ncbi:MAG: peptidylprolyl isomerase, partial [Bacteroidota bacterium]|nr:peptidylprolyl isomerase [Bacteroidota bacterium]